MSFFLYIVAVILVHVPGVVIRLVPFYNRTDHRLRVKLYGFYALYILIEIIACMIIYPHLNMTLTEFKLILMVGNMALFLINVFCIHNGSQQLFIGWVAASIIQCMFSIPAVVVDRLFPTSAMAIQCFIFAVALVIEFLIIAYPLYKNFCPMIRTMLRSSESYNWSHSWLLPFFIYASSFAYTLFSDWSTLDLVVGRILCMIASILSFKTLTDRINEYEERNELQHNTRLLKVQVSSMNRNIANIQDSQNRIRILRHDMRHRIQLMNTLLANENYEEIKTILSELNTELDETVITTYCVNPVLNAAISAYVERAKEEGFSVNVHISLPDKLPVDATQLAVAISNALDNEIHAGMAENEKKLELISSYNSTCITVIIKNTFNGNVEIGDDGLPVPTKNSDGEHGIGIRSIIAFANANNADFTYSVENNQFIVRLIIWNE